MAPPTRLVILGADAAGVAAAQYAVSTHEKLAQHSKRPGLAVTVLDRRPHLHCPELPPQVKLRAGMVCQQVDLTGGQLAMWSGAGAELVPFDRLIFATGATPGRPAWLDRTNRCTLLTEANNAAQITSRVPPEAGVVAVVGDNAAAIAAATWLRAAGHGVILLAKTATLIEGIVPTPIADKIAKRLVAAGVTLATQARVAGVHDTATAVVLDIAGQRTPVEADWVVCASDQQPGTALGIQVGLAIGEHGGFLPNNRQQLAAGVWAAGQCCEVRSGVTGRFEYQHSPELEVAMGQVAGTNAAGGMAVSPPLVPVWQMRCAGFEVVSLGAPYADHCGASDVVCGVGEHRDQDQGLTVAAVSGATGQLVGVHVFGENHHLERVEQLEKLVACRFRAADVPAEVAAHEPVAAACAAALKAMSVAPVG